MNKIRYAILDPRPPGRGIRPDDTVMVIKQVNDEGGPEWWVVYVKEAYQSQATEMVTALNAMEGINE